MVPYGASDEGAIFARAVPRSYNSALNSNSKDARILPGSMRPSSEGLYGLLSTATGYSWMLVGNVSPFTWFWTLSAREDIFCVANSNTYGTKPASKGC